MKRTTKRLAFEMQTIRRMTEMLDEHLRAARGGYVEGPSRAEERTTCSNSLVWQCPR
jgi:hypothetical protein